MLAAQHRQLRPQVLDLGRRRAEPRPHCGQLVPECGDLLLGCAVCQVHKATVADGQRLYNPEQSRPEPGRIVPQC